MTGPGTGETFSSLCVIGDTHGHLQLALCVAAQWQQVIGVSFDAVLLCGDVGTFTDDGQLDNATRGHAKTNPCELEFLRQWSVIPQPKYLARIFAPLSDGGLGLECPVVMVHGNHEGFEHLAELVPADRPEEPVPARDLPAVDSGEFIRLLPSGWTCTTPSGVTVGGIGGVEKGQREARYHEMAYIDADAVLDLAESEPFDVLVTHQGPEAVQGERGSPTLNYLLEEGKASYWFHGHSTPNTHIARCGPDNATTVVPMQDVAFPKKSHLSDDPGEDGWCWLYLSEPATIVRERPDFWREYRKRKWKELPNGQLVCPPLAGPAC